MAHQPNPAPKTGLDLLTTNEAAELLRCSPKTLEADRCRRRWRVPYVFVGRAIRYDRTAVLRWLADRNPELREA